MSRYREPKSSVDIYFTRTSQEPIRCPGCQQLIAPGESYETHIRYCDAYHTDMAWSRRFARPHRSCGPRVPCSA